MQAGQTFANAHPLAPAKRVFHDTELVFFARRSHFIPRQMEPQADIPQEICLKAKWVMGKKYQFFGTK